MTETLACAIYARVSTAEQQSAQTQIDLCQNWVNSRGHRTRYRLRDDSGKGRDNTRQAYSQLLEHAKNGKIQMIVVWKLDRLFRSLSEASRVQEILNKQGVGLASVTEPFDTTTSMGRFIFGFLANFAQFETDLIRDRASLGFERRVRQGKWTGSVPPFGYTVNDNGVLQIESDEARVVLKIVNMYLRVGSDREVAARLRNQGLLWRGSSWTSRRVRSVLSNPILTGEFTQRGSTQFHEQLQMMPKTKWDALQSAREQSFASGSPQAPTAREQAIERVMGYYLESLSEDLTS